MALSLGGHEGGLDPANKLFFDCEGQGSDRREVRVLGRTMRKSFVSINGVEKKRVYFLGKYLALAEGCQRNSADVSLELRKLIN